ncbi:MAG: trypsin-like serine protease [Candidatus Eisenbacteria bacterium]|nr:trypsin-like serine protease [Candidatus Latescibacterota bacterium]MBD3302717.1 trypsin-like serine protease [Candidatus Eisenbacteria bacterium]
MENREARFGGTTGAARRWIPLSLFLVGLIGGAIAWSIFGGRSEPEERAVDPLPVLAEAGSTEVAAEPAPDGTDDADEARSAPVIEDPEQDPAVSLTRGRRNAIVTAAERTGPAVVSISVVQTRYVRGRSRLDPFGSFFDRYLPGPIYRERVPSLGSGFLIDRAGVILTNEHVVHAAEQIKVTLSDGRTFDARLIGSDPNYDLAVLRIEGEDPQEPLPVARLGSSEEILVGEWVVALGNPFGFLLNDYQPTVTVGVISAVNRDIKPSGNTAGIYKNMIQTDAAINPGNSGGPLVNADGEVIGINTFIFTESGGSLGIGFAIPIDVAIRVVREILQYGEVRQVWIGIRVREISPYIAAYYSIQNPRGLIVWELEENSPAHRAGIEVGDIIREVNGEPVWKTAQAQRLIFGAAVGDRITLKIEREGRGREIELTLEAHPQREETG